MSDILDGTLYKSLYSKSNVNTNMITLTLNSAGVPVFKASAFYLWPLLCTVNEIKPCERKNSVLLLGVWFGKAKPVF